MAGKLNSTGELIKSATKGNVSFDIKKGVLLRFKPFVTIGQVAFPFRDVNNIAFSDLSADLTVNGEDVVVANMRGTSNVLNFDMNGVYSFGTNTSLNVTVPLRNPKNDSNISSKNERELIREKGLVLRLLVVDENGKIKIKWQKKDRD